MTPVGTGDTGDTGAAGVVERARAPRVHNRYHGDAPPGAVYIGRGAGARGQWGNPFVIGPPEDGKDGTREAVIAKHRAWLLAQPDLLRRVRAELAGRALLCFCKPAACHGDTLLEVANCDEETFAALLRSAGE